MTSIGSKEIIVVGGGLGGPLCALFMANRGYRVRLYEYREDPRTSKVMTGRSINLSVSSRGLRALRKVDLEKEILRQSIPMRGRLVHNPDGTTKSLLYDTFNRKHINSAERHRINVVLLDAIEKKSNVRLYFNHKLITADLEIGETTFVDLSTNQTVVDQADLIIGADGAYSALRRAMQASFLFSMSQTYIDHGYMELTIKPEKGKTMTPNHLHIWPRADFMLIALPNRDGSWTATLIMPFKRFDTLKTAEDILTFFQSTFPDFVPLVGKDHLVETLANRKASGLLMITCSSFNVAGKALLIGDAAHAMLPFYGQGMNAAFEDCMILDRIIGECNGDLPKAIQRFSDERKEDAQAISDLAKYNYVEMRNLVTKRTFLLRKLIDDILHWLLKDKWTPLYNSVTFSEMSYKQCIENRRWQNEILLKIIIGFTAAIIFVVGLYLSM